MKRFQILALDGGGVKALFSAVIAAKLEEDFGTTITKHFDLIVGTSAGGIIALALGVGLPPKDIVNFYLKKGPQIFRNPNGWRTLQHWVRRKYAQERLFESLQELYGQHTLSDSSKRLVVTSFNLDDNSVYLFKTPHNSSLRRDWRVPLWQVGLATSAAPTFFPSSCHIDGIRLVDGGVWANNPSVVGIAEAVSMLNVAAEDIRILNIGTTTPSRQRKVKLTQGGLIAWRRAGIDVALTAQGASVYATAQHLVGKNNICRVDPIVPDELFKLDNANSASLYSLASTESRTFSPMFESTFLSHIAPAYKPLYPEIGVAA